MLHRALKSFFKKCYFGKIEFSCFNQIKFINLFSFFSLHFLYPKKTLVYAML